jgi:hypothetical protein
MFNYLKHNLTVIIFGLVLGLAAFIRFFAAPISTGPDVAQFWAFAEVFRQHGIDFYRYAGATQDFFPYYGWTYAYPPIWILILGLAILCVPHSSAGVVNIDPSWRLAAKTPIILADLAVGILLYWALPCSKWSRLIFSGLWLLNPTAWYNSAVFGQFDAIATAFLIGGLVFLEKGRDKIAFLLIALAGMTKQTAFLPLAMIAAAYTALNPWPKALKNMAVAAAVFVVISAPFLLTGNFRMYFQSLFFSGQKPEYVDPVIYSFNGLATLATYLHQTKGWDTSAFFVAILPVLMAAFLVSLFLVYRRRLVYARAALIGILVFIAFFYRINYQYLVLVMALALMIAASTPYLSERIVTLALAILPATWVWLYEVNFWFYCYEPKYYWPGHILSKLGLAHSTAPDYLFVILALLLNILCLIYLVCAFTRWSKPLKSLFSR